MSFLCRQPKLQPLALSHPLDTISLYISGVASQEKSWLHQKNYELNREMVSEQNKDQVQDPKMNKKGTLVENGKEQQISMDKKEEEVGEEMEVGEKVEMGEEVEVEVGEEEEIRMRQHSPRMTLPMQWKKENEKKQDVAGEELRRISPKFEGGGGKVSKEAGETKMYLFGLV